MRKRSDISHLHLFELLSIFNYHIKVHTLCVLVSAVLSILINVSWINWYWIWIGCLSISMCVLCFGLSGTITELSISCRWELLLSTFCLESRQKYFFSVFKLTLLQDLRFSHLLPSGQVVKDQLNISGKLRQRTVRKGIFKKYSKLCTYVRTKKE